MIIRASSLVDRFYVSDGWTRKKVSELVILSENKSSHNPLFYVIPRYYDSKKEIELNNLYDYNNYLPVDYQFLDCDYYSIYDYSIKLKNYEENGHEYIPFDY